MDVTDLQIIQIATGISDHPQGTRRGIPDGPAASLAPVQPPACDPPHPASDRSKRSANSSIAGGLSWSTRRSSPPPPARGPRTLFETDYFDLGKAYLTQSGQLYGEAGAMAFGKVYVFGPTFRAEKSKTRRHLTEFWMVEPEVAFNELNDDMDLAEEFLESHRPVRPDAQDAGTAAARAEREVPRKRETARCRASPMTRPWRSSISTISPLSGETTWGAPTRPWSPSNSTGR